MQLQMDDNALDPSRICDGIEMIANERPSRHVACAALEGRWLSAFNPPTTQQP